MTVSYSTHAKFDGAAVWLKICCRHETSIIKPINVPIDERLKLP